MISPNDKLGPNLKRLLIEFMTKQQVDRASVAKQPDRFGLACAITADIVAGGFAGEARVALGYLNEAIAAIRYAAEPNPYKNSTDEEIAGAILDRLEQRRQVA